MSKSQAILRTLHAHQGKSLVSNANNYPNLVDVIAEQVQNAIDADAGHIEIHLNRKKRNCFIFDDGNGVTVDMFLEALASVGDTLKVPKKMSTDSDFERLKNDREKLGRFGWGLISPLGKCAYSTFTSCHKSGDLYRTWKFATADIEQMRDEIVIPEEPEPQLLFGKKKGYLTIDSKKVEQVVWRTRVAIYQYSNDSVIARIGSIDDLLKRLFVDFGIVMSNRGIKLSIIFTDLQNKSEERKNVEAPKYTGEPLPPHVEQDLRQGLVQFRLYLASTNFAKKTGRPASKPKGVISFGETHNPYRFSVHEFVKHHGKYLKEETIAALRSGYFEGEITSNTVSLHVSRRKFEDNQYVEAMAWAIDNWYATVGSQHIEHAKDTAQQERWAEIGERSMMSIERIFRGSDYESLLQADTDMQQMVHESGQGQFDVVIKPSKPRNKPKPKPDNVVPEEPGNDLSDSSDTSGPRKKTPPNTVFGKRGRVRSVVASRKLGLRFGITEVFGVDDLWTLEQVSNEYVIWFNTIHPTWSECDKNRNDRRLQQLMELVAVQVLEWLFMSPEEQNRVKATFDSLSSHHARLLIMSDAFNK